MFAHSQSYKVHAEIRYQITELMQEEFASEFAVYLHSFYELQNWGLTKTFFTWLAERGGYSAVVGGRDPINDMFRILEDAVTIFGGVDEFRQRLQIYLGETYRNEADTKWLYVKIIEPIAGKTTGLEELLTFELDPYEGFRD